MESKHKLLLLVTRFNRLKFCTVTSVRMLSLWDSKENMSEVKAEIRSEKKYRAADLLNRTREQKVNSSWPTTKLRRGGNSGQVCFSNERKASSERSSRWRLPLVAPVHSVRS